MQAIAGVVGSSLACDMSQHLVTTQSKVQFSIDTWLILSGPLQHYHQCCVQLAGGKRAVPAEFGGQLVCVHIMSPEQGIKLLGLLLTGSTGQRTASRSGLA